MTGRRPRPIFLVVAGLGVLLFVIALVAEVGGTSVDPTEQTFAVRLQNDTTGTVVVKQCDARCDSFHEQDRLPPGGSVEVNTFSDDAANWWAVTDSTGRTLGYLPLRYEHKIDGLIMKVSHRTSCPEGSAGSTSGVLGSIAGFGLFFLVAGIGLASIVFSTISARRWIAPRVLGGGAAAALTASAALLSFLGGWLVFDFYVLVCACSRLVRRRADPQFH